MVHIPLEKMTRKEKWEALDLIWEDLVRDQEKMESPAWHEEELRRTKERVSAGLEKFIPLETAMKQLRRRRR